MLKESVNFILKMKMVFPRLGCGYNSNDFFGVSIGAPLAKGVLKTEIRGHFYKNAFFLN